MGYPDLMLEERTMYLVGLGGRIRVQDTSLTQWLLLRAADDIGMTEHDLAKLRYANCNSEGIHWDSGLGFRDLGSGSCGHTVFRV